MSSSFQRIPRPGDPKPAFSRALAHNRWAPSLVRCTLERCLTSGLPPLARAARTPADPAAPRAVSTKAAEEKKEEFAVGALEIVYNEFSEVRALPAAPPRDATRRARLP